jgi:hypothetical protein
LVYLPVITHTPRISLFLQIIRWHAFQCPLGAELFEFLLGTKVFSVVDFMDSHINEENYHSGSDGNQDPNRTL